MKSNKGVIGGFMTLFVATIIIVLLVLFFIFSSVVKKIDNSEAGVRVVGEEKVGVTGLETYMDRDYKEIMDLRLRKQKGESVESILGGELNA